MPQSFVSTDASAERRLDPVGPAAVCDAIGVLLDDVVARFRDDG